MAAKTDVFEKAVQLGVQGNADGLAHLLTEDIAEQKFRARRSGLRLIARVVMLHRLESLHPGKRGLGPEQ